MKVTETYIDFGGTVYTFDQIKKLPYTKETALLHHINIDRCSWTFERMTDAEKERCISSLVWAWEQGIVKGTKESRWKILNGLYSVFLDGLGYDGPYWREAV